MEYTVRIFKLYTTFFLIFTFFLFITWASAVLFFMKNYSQKYWLKEMQKPEKTEETGNGYCRDHIV